MKYLKLFNNHSGYTEYMEGDVVKPNVSHCIYEDDVHYTNRLPAVLPGNEEAWELYSVLICNDTELKQDLLNIFTQYTVNVSSSTFEGAHRPGDEAPYIALGYTFTYNDGSNTYNRRITTEVTWTNSGVTPPQSTINDCGESIVEIGDWNRQENGGMVE